MIVAALAAMVMVTGLSADMGVRAEECRQALKRCDVNLLKVNYYLQRKDYTEVRSLINTFETTLWPNLTKGCSGILSDQMYNVLKTNSELWIYEVKKKSKGK